MKHIFLLSFLFVALYSCTTRETIDADDPTYKLAYRVLGESAKYFEFETIESQEKSDVFEIVSKADKILIKGNTGVAKASGLNYYLENYCNCQVSMNYSQVNLPDDLPKVVDKIRVVTPFEYRYIFNYCTYGYTMPWWDWNRWENMIDYMAMKGVNMPLAVIGQESVWKAVFEDFGMSQKQIDDFFVGPAHLPWGWMGNIDGIGGPLPDSWYNKRTELQKKVLTRQRELGMKPVLQAFTGHVPKCFTEMFPDAKIMQIDSWAGIPGTQFLDPTDPLFQKIGNAFIDKQTEMFGTDHLYDADCFIEVDPPSKDPKFLADVSAAVYNSMAGADPEATWVLQGWFFFFKKDFWHPEQGRGFFNGIPKDKVIAIDLYGEANTVWDKTESFFGQPWLWNVICNEDQKVNMSGNLDQMQKNFEQAFVQEGKNNLKGIGVIPEGIGFNPIVQDFVFEKVWDQKEVDLEQWVRSYARRRYGKQSDKAEQAWVYFLKTVYGRTRTMWSPLITTPHLKNYSGGKKEDIRHNRIDFSVSDSDKFAWDFDVAEFAKGAKLLLACSSEFKDVDTWQFDMANVYRELVHAYTHRNISNLSSAYEQKDIKSFEIASENLLRQLDDLERITGTNQNFMLGKWLEDSKSWGDTKSQEDFFEWNARTIITIWQPWKTGGLRDYAGKQWNGLFSGYYKPRWELFISHLWKSMDTGVDFDASKFDNEVREMDYNWTKSNELYPVTPTGNTITIAQELFELYGAPLVK